MPTPVATGTLNLTSAAETPFGAAQTVDGNYVLVIDLSNMVNGQEVEIKVKQKVLAGGAAIVFYHGVYCHVQAEPGVISIPLSSTEQWTATATKTAGANLDIPYRVDLL